MSAKIALPVVLSLALVACAVLALRSVSTATVAFENVLSGRAQQVAQIEP